MHRLRSSTKGGSPNTTCRQIRRHLREVVTNKPMKEEQYSAGGEKGDGEMRGSPDHRRKERL